MFAKKLVSSLFSRPGLSCYWHTTKRDKAGLVIGVYQSEIRGKGPILTTSGEIFNAQAEGRLRHLVLDTNINGCLAHGRIFTKLHPKYEHIAVVGLGREVFNTEKESQNVLVAAGVGARSLQIAGCSKVYVDGMRMPEQAAIGSSLAVWNYHNCFKMGARVCIPKLQLFGNFGRYKWQQGVREARAEHLSKQLRLTATPTALAKSAVNALLPCNAAIEICNIPVKSLSDTNSNCSGCSMVMEVSYYGSDPEEEPLTLIGRGIDFKNGDLSIRTAEAEAEFQDGIKGAALIAATVRAAAQLSLPINIYAIIPMYDNLDLDTKIDPDDVLKMLSKNQPKVVDEDKKGTAILL